MSADRIYVIETGPLAVNTLIVEIGEGKCFVVDPAASRFSNDKNKILDFLATKNLECVGILLTHSHFDHILGISVLKAKFPEAHILIHEAEAIELQNPPGPMGEAVIQFFNCKEMLLEIQEQPAADILLKDGQNLSCIGAKKWVVIHTPGHTPGSICLYNKQDKLFISGDTLFSRGDYGRTDMYGGDFSAICRSLRLIKRTIDADTKIYPGHDECGFSL